MSYPTNNPASNKTSKILLEFKIKIEGLLPGGYQTSPRISLTTRMLLTATDTLSSYLESLPQETQFLNGFLFSHSSIEAEL